MNLLAPQFTDADKAREYLENIRWPDGPACPHCGDTKAYTITRKKEGAKTRKGLYKCAGCRKQYTVTVGTVFEGSKVPLNKWLLASYLIASSKKGFSAHQLHRSIGVTYKTTWFMFHRLREAMTDDFMRTTLGGEGKVVEADETYWGNNRTKGVKPRAGGGHKEKVFALVERNGNVRSFHIPTVTAKTLGPILTEQVDKETRLMTDEHKAYKTPGKQFKSHETVAHSLKEYARGDISTNTIEGVFSLLKRGLHGSYHHVAPEHLHRYLAEFDFRYNRRDTSDSERTDALLANAEGKRLTYRRPTAQDSETQQIEQVSC